MEFSMKTVTLFAAVILTGLSAGFFYAWSVSVIPGTQKASAQTYMEVMQSINRAILNPAFFSIFFGSIIVLSIASIYQFHIHKLTFWFMLASSICYFLGTLGVTALGNVPLNNELEALNLPELTNTKLEEFRTYYETNWNKLHLIRTVCAIGSFLLTVIAAFTQLPTFK